MTRTGTPAVRQRFPRFGALRVTAWAEDLALVVALVAIGTLTGVVLVVPQLPQAPGNLTIFAWAVLLAAPLFWRRRFPIAVLTVTLFQLPFYWGFGRENEIAAWMALGIAVYSASAYGRRPLAGRVCALLLIGLVTLVVLTSPQPASGAEIAAGALFLAVPFLLAWPMGSIVRSLRSTRSELELRNAQLAREREASATRAVLEERVRIARELHDVVAHHVSLMSVQAGAARRLLDRRPDDARQAIGEVETAGRQAISDLDQLIGVLRSDAPEQGRGPQPGLAELPDLIAHTRKAGLAVDLQVDGDRRPLPVGVELCLYRIAQEALTNTLKHAGASSAQVRLCYRAAAVELDVVDDGVGPGESPISHSGGRGLVGMRERVGLRGGLLELGPGPSGGFRVHAEVAV
jgi:signal transduction histidine kinase